MKTFKLPRTDFEREDLLSSTRALKMATSPHRYVRGSTEQFYAWLDDLKGGELPEGPPIWICGDCHVGNLGPIANASGKIEIQIRDLDQTIIGNPAHDLVRLGLSLASAARGSNLPGVITARMIEHMMDGYRSAFEECPGKEPELVQPKAVQLSIRRSRTATWSSLAKSRIRNPNPTIPRGRRYWPLYDAERAEIDRLFALDEMRELVTMLKGRDARSTIEIADAAYWVKGCSSLGKLRYAVLLLLRGKGKPGQCCLIDLKEAAAPAPTADTSSLRMDPAERVVAGARRLAPYLGERMRAATLLGKPMIVRELRPQDLKLEIDRLTLEEATMAAKYLAAVVGRAHAGQMNRLNRDTWLKDLSRDRSERLDAPNWLWKSVVELLSRHERAYLEHCRKYALTTH